MIPWLGRRPAFPPLSQALIEPNGLLAAGGALSPEWILAAYKHGIFPWFNEGDPILWWSPNPRMVLYPNELKVSRSLAKTLRNKAYTIRFDTAFREVMQACSATPRRGQDGTWIGPAIIDGYCALHALGYAHSAECWIEGKLVGGLYGIAIGRMFYGESMFAHQSDASKLAFVHLVRWLESRNFGLIDCQMKTEHLASLGGRQIDRDLFLQNLTRLIAEGEPPQRWQYDVTVGASLAEPKP
ncbi:leucyl/phenylalanyl-tRNA--protein transferase [Parachitinimonas caeni]|uniref:Leucyl/phenylalanyl-tRNA--protein transferase n=1 Tax=Parachitinimonas caeni TaxID=3031301 RepID=A0ABT7DUC0_9NEIS|nr:leucyl/phenylalanyl-tRNA--protein transferase [Parachitinimonas caeni]MDK2123680.1 leucyl/phenylalanyl-tRNA--protein transferase [Parachitinimonas caeni]